MLSVQEFDITTPLPSHLLCYKITWNSRKQRSMVSLFTYLPCGLQSWRNLTASHMGGFLRILGVWRDTLDEYENKHLGLWRVRTHNNNDWATTAHVPDSADPVTGSFSLTPTWTWIHIPPNITSSPSTALSSQSPATQQVASWNYTVSDPTFTPFWGRQSCRRSACWYFKICFGSLQSSIRWTCSRHSAREGVSMLARLTIWKMI
jgi:hypothetical protein